MPVVTGPLLPDSLVSTAWLEDHLKAPSLRLIDIRGYVKTSDLGGGRQHADYVAARDEYENGHLPGAVYVDWTADITDPTNPVKAQIASPHRFAAAMAQRGVGNETDVVVIDHSGGHFATRLWWALRYHGHDRVAVLEGGQNKWVAEGRPLSRQQPTPRPARFDATIQPSLRVEVEEIVGLLDQSHVVVVDARDPAQYSGAIARGDRGGHIPGAVNIPASSLVNADGTAKPIEDQRRVLEAGGIRPGDRVVAYCNGGVTATALLFALHRAGHIQFANYDGSWNEWGARGDLPITSGLNPR